MNIKLWQKLLLACYCVNFVKAFEWHYEGSPDWGKQFEQCNGKHQSPIDLRFDNPQAISDGYLKFKNYDDPMYNLDFTHTGHTVEMKVVPTIKGGQPQIKSGPLNGTYKAQRVAFHWGSMNTTGSEHTINGERYAVEMQIIHKNSLYANDEEAQKHANGFAILSILMQIENDANIFYPALNYFFNNLEVIKHVNATTKFPGPLSLSSILGDVDYRRYFVYNGSWTSPPCTESVTWIVFPQALTVDAGKISQFYKVLDENNKPMANNYRPIQDNTDTLVYY